MFTINFTLLSSFYLRMLGFSLIHADIHRVKFSEALEYA